MFAGFLRGRLLRKPSAAPACCWKSDRGGRLSACVKQGPSVSEARVIRRARPGREWWCDFKGQRVALLMANRHSAQVRFREKVI